MNWHVIAAIFKRNFISYFSSPTGYVFICVFVALTSLAAFWPHEFFNANLANLDQLNIYLPAIMLVFIPAITMSVWAEERRQGTDELLLTIPASDFDVVLGKFLASLAIFSVALAFSAFANFAVLKALGGPDVGLFAGTYIGYWMIGMTMISIGMVASFLTNNLTVGFIFGAVFNAPLVLSVYADTIIRDSATAQMVKQWSMTAFFRDFERGVISLSAISYFVMVTVVMLYLAMVLIGRRHWMGGRDGSSMAGHYFVRTLALLIIAIGVTAVFANRNVMRVDITSEQLSSVSPQTRKLLKELDPKFPIVVEAYISPNVPQEYVQTKLNLLSMLDEINALSGGKVQVHKYIIENFSQEADLAEKKHGIKPQTVFSKSRGAMTQEDIYLGVSFTSGLEKEVLPFIDKGLPAEYELVRSICVVAQGKREKIGVLKTDAQLFGGFNFQTFSQSEDQQIITELKKQYEVVEVDPAQPIDPKQYKMLLAVQPSSLAQPELTNFLEAIRSGLPTAVFEDPFPLPRFWMGVSGTRQPREQQQMNMMNMQQPKPEKGKIYELWDLLGVEMIGDEIIWQNYNPYPKVQFEPEFVFVDPDNGNNDAFNEDDTITRGLQQPVLFIFPGSFDKQGKSKLKYDVLCSTGIRTGTLGFDDLRRATSPGGPGLETVREPRKREFAVAVHVHGPAPKSLPSRTEKLGQHETPEQPLVTLAQHETKVEAKADAKAGDAKDTKAVSTDPEMNVVLVADIDCLLSEIFRMRSRGAEEDDPIKWNLQNVSFILNTVDSLSGDDRFVDIRTRNRDHRTLKAIDDRTEESRNDANDERKKFVEEFERERTAAQRKLNQRVQEIRDRKDLNPFEKAQQLDFVQEHGQRGLDATITELEQERDQKLKTIERDLELEVRKVQDGYKLWAVLLPPIPPLLLAFFVFFHRRSQEREGVSKSRLR